MVKANGMIEVGLVGFGLAGKFFHAQVIRAVAGLHLAAIVQRSGDDAARTYPDVRIVCSLDELLEMESIRLIAIATPNQTHFDFAKRCLEAGRDVVVDKPFTTTVAEAVELFRIANKRGRMLTVFHSRRFDADFQGLREFLANRPLGRVIRFEEHYDRYRPAPKVGAWREIPGRGSGILFDLGPHLIDHALMLFGRPLAISADLRMERDGAITDDSFDLRLEYPQDMRAQLSATMLSLTPRPRYVVLGTKGSYIKRDFDPLENALRNLLVPAENCWMMEKEANWGEASVWENGETLRNRVASIGSWRDFYLNVRDALLGKAELQVTPHQVIDVMVALELAQQSAAEGHVVSWRNVRMESASRARHQT